MDRGRWPLPLVEISTHGAALCRHAALNEDRTAGGTDVSAIDHPLHYGGESNPYEVIKVLEAWLTPDEFRGFCKGNVHKYLARAQLKGSTEDEAKAAWYAARLVDFNKRFER